MRIERPRHYALFCGHRGCGKSTELRRLADRLRRPETFFVILLDGVRDLDANNLQYVDVLLAFAQKLVEALAEASVDVGTLHLRRLEEWFDERVQKHESTKDFAIDVKAGAEGSAGLPLLGKLFASITNSFRTNSTYKEELRRVLKNSFSEFASAFNQLIAAAETALKDSSKGKKLLFIVDGTDRLRGDDSKRFFIEDIHQLQLVDGLFIYCAPIHLIYETADVSQFFDHVFKLPMVKLAKKGSKRKLRAGYDALRNLVSLRADLSLFDSRRTLDYLIEHSGGHPRDLLRLLDYSFELSESDRFDRPAARKAVKALASDYRRLLDSDDYDIVRQIDTSPAGTSHGSERVRYLLFNLIVLEYNDFWWQSHPVVRTLPGYAKADSQSS